MAEENEREELPADAALLWGQRRRWSRAGTGVTSLLVVRQQHFEFLLRDGSEIAHVVVISPVDAAVVVRASGTALRGTRTRGVVAVTVVATVTAAVVVGAVVGDVFFDDEALVHVVQIRLRNRQVARRHRSNSPLRGHGGRQHHGRCCRRKLGNRCAVKLRSDVVVACTGSQRVEQIWQDGRGGRSPVVAGHGSPAQGSRRGRARGGWLGRGSFPQVARPTTDGAGQRLHFFGRLRGEPQVLESVESAAGDPPRIRVVLGTRRGDQVCDPRCPGARGDQGRVVGTPRAQIRGEVQSERPGRAGLERGRGGPSEDSEHGFATLLDEMRGVQRVRVLEAVPVTRPAESRRRSRHAGHVRAKELLVRFHRGEDHRVELFELHPVEHREAWAPMRVVRGRQHGHGIATGCAMVDARIAQSLCEEKPRPELSFRFCSTVDVVAVVAAELVVRRIAVVGGTTLASAASAADAAADVGIVLAAPATWVAALVPLVVRLVLRFVRSSIRAMRLFRQP